MKKKIIILAMGIILIGLVAVIYNFGNNSERSGEGNKDENSGINDGVLENEEGIDEEEENGGSSEVDGGEILDNPIEECARVEGEWRSFSSACVDSCFYERNKEEGVACAAVMTDGCDCGKERCWNGESCEDN